MVPWKQLINLRLYPYYPYIVNETCNLNHIEASKALLVIAKILLHYENMESKSRALIHL